jgi:hypothetical protein
MDSDPNSGPYGASIIYIEVSSKYLRWTVILAVAPMVPPLFILKSALSTYDGLNLAVAPMVTVHHKYLRADFNINSDKGKCMNLITKN